MRDILFRGKRKDNREWVYGYVYRIWERVYILWGMTNDVPNMIEVDPETVGQFTGLYDSTKWEDLTEKKREEFARAGNFPSEWNGKKIFEGDVCRVNLGNEILNGYVEYDERCGSWRIIFKEPHCILFLDLWFKRNEPGIWCEVIGNRWDNPELLEK